MRKKESFGVVVREASNIATRARSNSKTFGPGYNPFALGAASPYSTGSQGSFKAKKKMKRKKVRYVIVKENR